MRSAALTLGLSLVLTSCGLAARSSVAVAPDEVAAFEAAASLEAEPVADAVVPAVAPADIAPTEPEVIARPAGPAASVAPMTYVSQTLNNCGPASVVMALSTFGVEASQEDARLALRGPDVRRGMGPTPVGPWVAEQFGLRAVWRNNGTNALMKALVSNGFAPLVTQWMEDPSVSRVAHWRAVRGYDDGRGVFVVNDPIRGKDLALTYDWFARNWQAFSYRYLVIYRPEDEPLVRAIVGDDWTDRNMRARYYERAKEEALAQGTSAAWLAFGEAAYGHGSFEEAVGAFERGLSLGSAQGVFTLRSSYPQALRAIGRFDEAAAAQQRFRSAPTAP